MSKTETITSREIAEFTGKRHDNVLADIRRLYTRIGMHRSNFTAEWTDSNNVVRTMYTLPRRVADQLLMSYGPDVRANVLARWNPADYALATHYSQPTVAAVPTTSVSTGVTRIMSPELTMGSQEIADLVGSRHDDVKRSIERLASKDVISYPPLAEKPRSVGRPGKEYIFQGEKGKRDSIIVVAQLSPEFTAKLVDRWQELEAQVAKPVAAPNLNDPAALRGLLLGYTEQVMQLEHQVGVQAEKIAEDEPKVKVFTRLVDQKGFITFQKFCTQLNLHQRKVKAWLRDIGWLRADQWEVNPLPTAKAVDAGYCDIKRFETDSGKLVQQIVFTGKAEAYVELKAPDYIRKPVRKERKKAA